MIINRQYKPEACLIDSFAVKGNLAKSKLGINYNVDSQTLEVKWIGTVNSYEVRVGYALIMEYVQRYKPAKWLLDLQNRDTIERADQYWVFTHFFPEVLKVVGNDVFIATVLPVGSAHELVLELKGDELIQGNNLMIINNFMYQEAARRWLEYNNSN